MGFLKFFNRDIGIRRFWGDVCGQSVEVRVGTWGRRSVFVNGILVVDRPVFGIGADLIEVTTTNGTVRQANIRVSDASGWIGQCRVEVEVEGDPVVVLAEVGRIPVRGKCPRCGYELRGLEPVNGEIRCPECGRQTAEELVR